MFIRISEDIRSKLKPHVIQIIRDYIDETKLNRGNTLTLEQTTALAHVVHQLMDEIEGNI